MVDRLTQRSLSKVEASFKETAGLFVIYLRKNVKAQRQMSRDGSLNLESLVLSYSFVVFLHHPSSLIHQPRFLNSVIL